MHLRVRTPHLRELESVGTLEIGDVGAVALHQSLIFAPVEALAYVAHGTERILDIATRLVDGGGVSRITCRSPGSTRSTREGATDVSCGVGS